MESAKAAEPLGFEPASARLASKVDDLTADLRLERIAGLAALVFSVPRAAVLLIRDGEISVAGSIASHDEDWPSAEALELLPKHLCEAVFSSRDGGFHAVAPLLGADNQMLGLLVLDDPAPRAAPSARDKKVLVELAAVAAGEVVRMRDQTELESLHAELDHRVKNVLAAVQSLASQSARKSSSLDSFLKTFTGRLKSMASAHQLLTATRWRGASIQNIATAELGGLAPGQTGWQGPDLFLTPKAAHATSMALHELATNAVKFGALSTELGRVEVVWRTTENGGFVLEWIETGGPPVAQPVRYGFGATLLDKVTGRSLDGVVRVDHRREGVRATLIAGPSALTAPVPSASAPVRTKTPPSLAGSSAGSRYRDAAGRINGLRVLIVEDVLLLALELEAGLNEAGARIVGVAADVEEGLRMAELPIDVAVLDANLNGASVLPVAQALTARGVPFILATGYADSKFAPPGFDAPVIMKPYDVTQVAAALAEVAARTV